jgi:hypothetical protein
MRPVYRPQTSVTHHHYTLRNILEERRPYSLRRYRKYCPERLTTITITINQSCVSSEDSELDRVSSGLITSPSLSKFGGSYPQGLQTCPFSVGVCSLNRESRFWGAENLPSSAPLCNYESCIAQGSRARKKINWKTQETLARTAVTLETERIKGSNPWCLWWWWWTITITKQLFEIWMLDLPDVKQRC